MQSRSKLLLKKSIDAMLAAIETYNKPNFFYREETFSILAINSWELLLKARILQLEKNKVSSIFEYEKRTLANGDKSQKKYRKLNRSGNPVSIGLYKACRKLKNDYKDDISQAVFSNLELLTEIRDNSIHLVNKTGAVELKIQEIATASLVNYIALARQWFGVDFSQYHIFLMPLAFVRNFGVAEGIVLSQQEKKLLSMIDAMKNPSKEGDNYSLLVKIDMRLHKNTEKGNAEVRLSRSEDATPIRIEEESIMDRYPLSFNNLKAKLTNRYTNFSFNKDFYALKKALEQDEKLCKTRLLDPSNEKGQKKKFYSPNILKEFDKHYNRQLIKAPNDDD
ncbi:DUF3644 domain-containing protein [Pseudomonas sp. 8O]|uniref:DUF3644 domain-containing protein n=1 Tax=Pseudomonas sp. 8O TaxID=2653165 RepID=UPI0012F3BEC2|nr:conserved hypothetical protein [Pseudomonas sp. 8O]